MPNRRIILITGASSGIGAATARALAGPGTALLLHARGGTDGAKRPMLEALAEEVLCAGSRVQVRFSDLTEPGAGAALVAEAKAFGRLDQVVANAGFADKRPIGTVTRADLDRALSGMTGSFLEIIDAALPLLEASSQGRVVAVSSFVAHVFKTGRTFPVTAAAKAAVEGLAKSLAAQAAPAGITVNCVAPGYTKKDATGHSALSEDAWKAAADLTPLGRIAEPVDIAALIAFLLSPAARHITGQVIHVDGGLSLG